MENPLLEIKNVYINYGNKCVVEDFSISLNKGEILGIVGESGSGKTTVLKSIIGILGHTGHITNGKIFFDGNDLLCIDDEEFRKLRGPGIGFVFQNCGASLCPIRTVGDQLYEFMNEHIKISKKDMNTQALELMKNINFTHGERILDSYPFEMSGGMNQRIGILMAMMMKPKLILADEPTSALDVTVQAQVVKELMRLRDIYNTGIIIVTHNIGLVSFMADKVAVMHKGKLIEYGSKEDIIKHPKMEYTKNLIASVPMISKE